MADSKASTDLDRVGEIEFASFVREWSASILTHFSQKQISSFISPEYSSTLKHKTKKKKGQTDAFSMLECFLLEIL